MPTKKPQIKSWFWYLPSAICVLLSAILFAQRYRPVVGNVQIAGTSSYTGELTAPAGIAIPSIGLNLPTVITYMQGKKWPTTPTGVSYLANSAIPGDQGNAVFYGHNWPAILGNLGNTKTGDKIVIQYQNGKTRDFTVDQVKIVGPNATEILASSETPKITLYTCTGFLDSQRLVVTAI